MAPMPIESNSPRSPVDIISLIPLGSPRSQEGDFRRLLSDIDNRPPRPTDLASHKAESSSSPEVDPPRAENASQESPERSKPAEEPEQERPADSTKATAVESEGLEQTVEDVEQVDPALIGGVPVEVKPEPDKVAVEASLPAGCEECETSAEPAAAETIASADHPEKLAAPDVENHSGIQADAPTDEAVGAAAEPAKGVVGGEVLKDPSVQELSDEAKVADGEPLSPEKERAELTKPPQQVTPASKRAASDDTPEVESASPVVAEEASLTDEAPVVVKATHDESHKTSETAGARQSVEQEDAAVAEDEANLPLGVDAEAESAEDAPADSEEETSKRPRSRKTSRRQTSASAHELPHQQPATPTEMAARQPSAAEVGNRSVGPVEEVPKSADPNGIPVPAVLVAGQPEEVRTPGEVRRSQAVADVRPEAVAAAKPTAGGESSGEGGLAERFAKSLGANPSPENRPDRIQRMQLIQRVTKAFQRANAGEGPIRLRLTPPELGTLRIEVQMRGAAMSAHLQAETPAAQSALLDNLSQLKAQLAEHDIHIEHFEVELLQQQGGDSLQHQNEQTQDSPHDRSHAPRPPSGSAGASSEPSTSTHHRADTLMDDSQLDVVV